jgi:5'-nucleotidase
MSYSDFTEVGSRLAAELKEKHGCDAVVAVTHMRIPNDRLVAQIPGIDLVLGGHDHNYAHEVLGSTTLVKSGSDFRDLSVIRLSRKAEGGVTIKVERHSITSEVPQDKEMTAVVFKWAGEMERQMDNRLGGSAVDLDCRFTSVRTRETNIANFIADR